MLFDLKQQVEGYPLHKEVSAGWRDRHYYELNDK